MSTVEEIAALVAGGSLRELLSHLAQFASVSEEQKLVLARHIEQFRAAGKLSAHDVIECLRVLQCSDHTVLLRPQAPGVHDSDATAALPANQGIESQETLIRSQPIQDATRRMVDSMGGLA